MLKAWLLSSMLSLNSAQPSAQLSVVGEAELKVLWFSVYEISLASPAGRYQPNHYPQLLSIDYLRAIDKQQLLDATEKEWQRLGLCEQRACQAWLTQLDNIWLGVEKGEQLSFLANTPDEGVFYYNGEFLGRVNQPDFAESFLAIWLSPNSRYPKQRQALTQLP